MAPPSACCSESASRSRSTTIPVINFGCPKVGNAAFAKLVNNKQNLCVHRVAHKSDVITRGPNLYYNHVGHTIHIDEAKDVEPRAFMWHNGKNAMTNRNPLMGYVLDHLMGGYIKALHSHKHDGINCEGEKPWVAAYEVMVNE